MAEITIKWMSGGGLCPVQYEGELSNGETFYFRARGQRWSFDVPIGTRIFREPWGEEEFDAGYMPYETAETLIRECVERYAAMKEVDG